MQECSVVSTLPMRPHHGMIGNVPSDIETQKTVGRLRQMVLTKRLDGVVRRAAVDIVRFLPPRDYVGQALAIRSWAGEHVKFLRDPLRMELLADPTLMVRSVRDNGFIDVDCDDAASLTASLGAAVGLYPRFQVLAFGSDKAPFQHIYTELSGDKKQWIEQDVTRGEENIPWGSVSRVWTVEV